MWGSGLYSTSSRYDRLMGSCKHGNDASGSSKWEKFIDQLRDYQFSKEELRSLEFCLVSDFILNQDHFRNWPSRCSDYHTCRMFSFSVNTSSWLTVFVYFADKIWISPCKKPRPLLLASSLPSWSSCHFSFDTSDLCKWHSVVQYNFSATVKRMCFKQEINNLTKRFCGNCSYVRCH
jgi:hypothetical protein